jgi:hypothetical protein
LPELVVVEPAYAAVHRPSADAAMTSLVVVVSERMRVSYRWVQCGFTWAKGVPAGKRTRVARFVSGHHDESTTQLDSRASDESPISDVVHRASTTGEGRSLQDRPLLADAVAPLPT